MEFTPETVAAAVSSFSSVRGQGTLPNLLAFGRALKELGVKVSLSQVIDASRSVELVDLAEKADFRSLLRSNLISQKEDFPSLRHAIRLFLARAELRAGADGNNGNSGNPDANLKPRKAAMKKALEEASRRPSPRKIVPLENLDEFSDPNLQSARAA